MNRTRDQGHMSTRCHQKIMVKSNKYTTQQISKDGGFFFASENDTQDKCNHTVKKYN